MLVLKPGDLSIIGLLMVVVEDGRGKSDDGGIVRISLMHGAPLYTI